MSKKLILGSNVQEYICGDKLYVEKDMILTPGAKDYCKERNITLVYGEPETKEPVETLREKVTRILKNDFNIVDENLVNTILRKCEGVRK